MAKLKVTVRPTLTVGFTLDLTNRRSALGETVSVSEAEQTPATVQDPEGLVLVKPGGGVSVATLRTELCACARGDSNSNTAIQMNGVLISLFNQ